MPTIQRVFLGWDQPVLPAAAEYLWQRYGQGDPWDLSGVLAVVPAGRAQRRLLEIVHAAAERRGVRCKLPRVVTVGDLPEHLYRPSGPLASEIEQTLAWTRVLNRAADAELAALLPTLPARDSIGPWMELAGTVMRLHETLASDGISFADVVAEVDTEGERRRWELLHRLYAGYLSELAQAGRVDPHLERRQAVVQGRCAARCDVLLIATADLNRVVADLLAQVAGQVTALVAAPSSEAARFDAFGAVLPARWSQAELPVTDQHLVSAGDAPSQAEAVAAQLADFGEHWSADAITVGVTDESFVALVETELEQCGLATHRQAGWPLAQTGPGRLLHLIAALLARGSWSALAALVRHADVYRWLDQQFTIDATEGTLGQPDGEPWIVQLDRLLAAHLPVRLQDPLPAAAQRSCPAAMRLVAHVDRWLAPLTAPRQSLERWAIAVGQVLGTIYADSDAAGPRTLRAIGAAERWLQRFRGLDAALDVDLPAAAALETLIGRLSEIRVVLPARPEAVEILGWLDLALDDAQAMVVMGMNHPFVPESVTADPFLPGALRTRLKIADNERRFARDAYLLRLILSARRTVRLVVGRRAVDGTPTPPSRLLAAAPPADVARRILRLLDQPPPSTAVTHRWSGAADAVALPIPPLDRAPAIASLSVTAFRDYLDCPYRFYLRHVLKLRPLDDAGRELAANQFGDLVHAAVERFGLSPQRDADQPGAIYDALAQHLNDYAAEHFGSDPAAAVRLQIVQAQRRLRVVAERQAARRQAGWRIWAAEAAVSENQGAGIEVDGRRIGIRGRLDRIDHHERTGQWAILDYKTHGHRPEKKHLHPTSGEWIDLQLPLYRLMVAHLGIDAPPDEVALGYFNISQKDEETGIHLAEFTEQQFAQANRRIEACVRDIWAGRFEISPQPVPFDDYAMICQTGIAQHLLDASETEPQEVFD